jgi:hypothetical protein
LQYSCLSLPSSGITGIYHPAQLVSSFPFHSVLFIDLLWFGLQWLPIALGKDNVLTLSQKS